MKTLTKEDIFKEYIKKICCNCNNKNINDCDIHITEFGAKCNNYKNDHINFELCMTHECAFCPQKAECEKKNN